MSLSVLQKWDACSYPTLSKASRSFFRKAGLASSDFASDRSRMGISLNAIMVTAHRDSEVRR